jgi:hypothetical protein
VSQSLSITPDNAQKAVQDALGAIAGAASLAELKEVRGVHVGEKSLLSQMNATLKDLPGDEKGNPRPQSSRLLRPARPNCRLPKKQLVFRRKRSI